MSPRAKAAIIHRLSPKMSIVHPWMICFDLPMPHEVFDLLNKEILGLTRFGIDTPGSVTITFSNLRRISYLFDKFQDCGGFRKQLGKGKGEAKLIVIFAIFGEIAEIAEIAVFAGHPCTSSNT